MITVKPQNGQTLTKYFNTYSVTSVAKAINSFMSLFLKYFTYLKRTGYYARQHHCRFVSYCFDVTLMAMDDAGI